MLSKHPHKSYILQPYQTYTLYDRPVIYKYSQMKDEVRIGIVATYRFFHVLTISTD
jgi:hypothetical protein